MDQRTSVPAEPFPQYSAGRRRHSERSPPAVCVVWEAGLRPEIYIKPKLDPDLKPENFDRMDEAIETGYSAAVEVLDTLDLET